MENGRMQILRRLEAGEIGAEEAAGLLAALTLAQKDAAPAVAPSGEAGQPIAAASQAGEVIDVAPQVDERPGQRWHRFWIYPFLVGTGVLALGALVLGLVYADGAAAGWLVCGWPLAVLGLLAVLLAIWSRWARWLHVRVREEGERPIAISFPVPLTLAAWVLGIAQRFVPQLKQTGADEVIVALRDSRRDEPLHVQVDDEEKGEHVEVYLG